MTAKIGTFNFVSLKGNVNPAKGEQLEVITRANVDGVAFRKTGKRAESFEMQSLVDGLSSTETALTLLDSYKAMQGTLVTLTLEDGSIYNNVMVLRVTEIERLPIKSSVGGIVPGSDYLLRCSWTLQMTETV